MSYRLKYSNQGTTGHSEWVTGLGALEALEEHREFMQAAEPGITIEIEAAEVPV